MKFIVSLGQAMRPHQWVKNALIFVPLLASNNLLDLSMIKRTMLAFAAYSSCASAMYIINDLLDLESDRLHPHKRHRPFAARRLSPASGLLAAVVLLLLAVVVGFWLGNAFACVLLVYVVATMAYSWFLKKQPLVDVFCLAGLYSLRLFAGQQATGIICSEWLLAFTLFLFLCLAVLKRFQEAFTLRDKKSAVLHGRGYLPADAEFLSVFGLVCGALAVLVIALYVNSDQVRMVYAHPSVLLLVSPLLLFWISRMWLLAHRGEMHHDPVLFALKDLSSWGIFFLVALVLVFAK
jgi:4-hydroxybenzoate polyprenyltransferase